MALSKPDTFKPLSRAAYPLSSAVAEFISHLGETGKKSPAR
ncbi:hypothetical protein [Aliifodinibius sp. S!AR15-10]|nr:hypothetical protein [Aliifodinibius sp. S!AR15-10]